MYYKQSWILAQHMQSAQGLQHLEPDISFGTLLIN